MRDALRPAAVGLLCILALALAAATLTTPVDVGDSGFGGGTGTEGEGPQSNGGPAAGAPNGTPMNFSGEGMGGPLLTICFDPLVEYPTGLLAGLFLLGLGTVVWYRSGTAMAAVTVGVALWPLFIAYMVLTAGCTAPGLTEQVTAGVGEIDPPTPGGGSGDGGDQAVTAPSVAVAAFLLLAIVGVAVAIVARRRDPVDDEEIEEAVPDPERRAEIGEVAGEAADRIEGEGDDLDNEVYRAWAEMTDALDVDDPETSTTAEFADAAVDAGLDPDDVRELTALFEEVRYGTAEPTPERERRAVDALRRIERQYADDGIDADAVGADAGDDRRDGGETGG